MPEPLLDLRAIDAYYGDFQALFGVSLSVNAGEVVAVIGANGAGKSTLLKCIAGLLPTRHGDIMFGGAPVGTAPAFEMVARGVALVPEGRRLFPSLTVEENLMIGGQAGRPGPWTLDRVYDLFPVLAERRHLREHGARAIGPKVNADCWPLPEHPQVAGILCVQSTIAVSQATDESAPCLFAENVTVGPAPLVRRSFDDRRKTLGDVAKEVMASIDNFA